MVGFQTKLSSYVLEEKYKIVRYCSVESRATFE